MMMKLTMTKSCETMTMVTGSFFSFRKSLNMSSRPIRVDVILEDRIVMLNDSLTTWKQAFVANVEAPTMHLMYNIIARSLKL